MAHFRAVYLIQRFKGFLYRILAVHTTHTFNTDRLCHGFVLLVIAVFLGFDLSIFTGIIHFEPVKTQCITYDTEAGKAHGSGSEHRVQQPSEDGIPYAGSQRDADDVIKERPKQILMDVTQGCAAQADRRGHIGKPALHEHHICGVDRDVGACADGDADISSCQSRGIVDAVAYHCNFAFLLQGTDHTLFSVRQYACDHFIHARLRSDSLCRAFVIACQHNHMNTHVTKLSDRFGAVFLDDVRHCDDTDQFSIPAEEQRSLSFFGEPVGCFSGIIRNPGILADKFQVASTDQRAIHFSGKAIARYSLEAFGIVFPKGRIFLRLYDDRMGERMLTLLFQGIGICQKLLFCYSVCRDHIRHFRFAAGDGPCLIQCDDLRPSRFLQGNSCFEQDTVFCAHTVADHDRHRRGKPKGARAAYNQNGNGSCQCKSDGLSGQHPDDKRDYSDGDHSRDKYSGHPVGDLGDGRLCGRRVADHLDDLRKSRILAHTGRLAPQIAGLVQSCGRYGVARIFINRNALAGQRGFVYRAGPFQDDTVYRDVLSGLNDEHIAFPHLVHGYDFFFAVPDYRRRLGSQLHQALQSVRGPSLGDCLQQLSYSDQSQDRAR